MRGNNYLLAQLNEQIKKWNAEHGDKPSKTITFLPPLSIESTATTSVPQDKNALLSSLESRVANLNAELEVEYKDITGDEGDLDLQQFLLENKDECKEHLFTE